MTSVFVGKIGDMRHADVAEGMQRVFRLVGVALDHTGGLLSLLVTLSVSFSKATATSRFI